MNTSPPMRAPIKRASAETNTSGARSVSGERSPTSIGSTPNSRGRVRQMPNHASPRENTASPQAGICGTGKVAAGQDAVVIATQTIASDPQPIGTNASHSSPSGISASAISPSGMVHIAVIGTATMFATTK